MGISAYMPGQQCIPIPGYDENIGTERELQEVFNKLRNGEECIFDVEYAPCAEGLANGAILTRRDSSVRLGSGTRRAFDRLLEMVSQLGRQHCLVERQLDNSPCCSIVHLERRPIVYGIGKEYTQLPAEFLYRLRQGLSHNANSTNFLKTNWPTTVRLKLYQGEGFSKEKINEPLYRESTDSTIFIGPGYKGLSEAKQREVTRCFCKLEGGENLEFRISEQGSKKKYIRLNLNRGEKETVEIGQKAMNVLAAKFAKLQDDCADVLQSFIHKGNGNKTLVFTPTESFSGEHLEKGVQLRPIENIEEGIPAEIEDKISTKEAFIKEVVGSLSRKENVQFEVSYRPESAKMKYSLKGVNFQVGQKTIDHITQRMREEGKRACFIFRKLTPIIPCTGEEVIIDSAQVCYIKTGDPELDQYAPEIRPTKIEMRVLESL